jgi:hypothetical protein
MRRHAAETVKIVGFDICLLNLMCRRVYSALPV